ncbi:sialidase family protein [Candidatus Methylacidiphilum infernorum]|uniref:Uncharacterized protein n=1 Tax=Methylacidiphilum infernorum (isolate V4) TaxID=481448 RepID=B3DZW0_METI4|nr:sialidase family protein [Candidatus Methylacidiphilum infernorum]ACD84295.1 Conserved hypothetical protein [Methylacidiphilum infernorum V4]
MELVRVFFLAWSLTCSLLFFGWPDASASQGKPNSFQPRHAEVTGTTGLDVYRDGKSIHLLLEEELSGQLPRLLYCRSADGGRSFSLPVYLPTNFTPVAGHRGADPQIAALGKKITIAWTGHGSGYMGRGKIGIAYSLDGGKSWFSGKNPADDNDSNGGHGFLDLCFDPGGRCHLVWLDERDGRVGLRAAFSDDGGKRWSANRTIDPETCTCCPNTILNVGSTLFVLYRMAHPRDTGLAVSFDRGEGWRRVGPLGDFHWEFLGCPHWGAGMAALSSGQKVILCAAVQTGKPERSGLYFLKSTDLGWNWSAPLVLAGPRGRFVDLAAAGQTLCAAWEDSGPSSSRVVASLSVDGGNSWSPPKAVSKDGTWATHPRVVGTEDGFLLLWTESRDLIQYRWNAARIDLR